MWIKIHMNELLLKIEINIFEMQVQGRIWPSQFHKLPYFAHMMHGITHCRLISPTWDQYDTKNKVSGLNICLVFFITFGLNHQCCYKNVCNVGSIYRSVSLFVYVLSTKKWIGKRQENYGGRHILSPSWCWSGLPLVSIWKWIPFDCQNRYAKANGDNLIYSHRHGADSSSILQPWFWSP